MSWDIKAEIVFHVVSLTLLDVKRRSEETEAREGDGAGATGGAVYITSGKGTMSTSGAVYVRTSDAGTVGSSGRLVLLSNEVMLVSLDVTHAI